MRVHPILDERGGLFAPPPTGVSTILPVAPTASGTEDEGRFSSAAGILLFLLLAAAVIGLVFATLPASTLSGISEQLVERRQDIGLAVAATLAGSAALFLIVMAA
jgi:hypothetical protein